MDKMLSWVLAYIFCKLMKYAKKHEKHLNSVITRYCYYNSQILFGTVILHGEKHLDMPKLGQKRSILNPKYTQNQCF